MRKGFLKDERFFRLLSEENNYVDPASIKDFYMGLIRVITKDLKTTGVCKVPHLGYFALVRQKDKLGLTGQVRSMVRGKYVLKFYPKEAWRDYFTKLESLPGLEGKLDPREKLLGEDLTQNLE